VAMILIVTLRYLRNLVFDARSLGGRLFAPRMRGSWQL